MAEADSQQRITTGIFGQSVAYFLAHGYPFLTPAAVLAGLDSVRKYALLTLDAGYYNTQLALPILRRYGGPGPADVVCRGLLSAADLTQLFGESRCLLHPAYVDNSPNSVCEAQLAQPI